MTYRSVCAAAVLAWVVLVEQSAGADEPLAVPADGNSFPARLVRITEAWELTFSASGADRTLPAADLVRWGRCDETPGEPAVVLADGGLLVASVTAGDPQELQADSRTFGAIAIPRPGVAGFVLQQPAQRLARDLLLDRIARYDGASDLLLLVNRDEVAGTFQAIEPDKIAWTTEIGPITVEPSRVAAVLFRPAGRPLEAAPLRVWSGFSDGSRLLARRLVRDEAQLEITTVSEKPWVALPEDLIFLQPVGGRAVYLSDLPSAGYRHVPYLDLEWPFQVDRNVLGGRLRANGQLFLKGLGMHTASRLSYALDKKYRRLDAQLAVDDAAEGGGSVRFRVFVDGKEVFTSQPQRGGQAPTPLELSVEGASRIDLVIDYAERGAVLDRADWLDVRVVP